MMPPSVVMVVALTNKGRFHANLTSWTPATLLVPPSSPWETQRSQHSFKVLTKSRRGAPAKLSAAPLANRKVSWTWGSLKQTSAAPTTRKTLKKTWKWRSFVVFWNQFSNKWSCSNNTLAHKLTCKSLSYKTTVVTGQLHSMQSRWRSWMQALQWETSWQPQLLASSKMWRSLIWSTKKRRSRIVNSSLFICRKHRNWHIYRYHATKYHWAISRVWLS